MSHLQLVPKHTKTLVVPTVDPGVDLWHKHRVRSALPAGWSAQKGKQTNSKWPPAAAKPLTWGKSGIVTSSRSWGRPPLPAELLRKLATEALCSCTDHQGAKQSNKKHLSSFLTFFFPIIDHCILSLEKKWMNSLVSVRVTWKENEKKGLHTGYHVLYTSNSANHAKKPSCNNV